MPYTFAGEDSILYQITKQLEEITPDQYRIPGGGKLKSSDYVYGIATDHIKRLLTLYWDEAIATNAREEELPFSVGRNDKYYLDLLLGLFWLEVSHRFTSHRQDELVIRSDWSIVLPDPTDNQQPQDDEVFADLQRIMGFDPARLPAADFDPELEKGFVEVFESLLEDKDLWKGIN